MSGVLDSDRAKVDAILLSCGVADALGHGASGDGLRTQARALRAYLDEKDEYAEFHALILGDNNIDAFDMLAIP